MEGREQPEILPSLPRHGSLSGFRERNGLGLATESPRESAKRTSIAAIYLLVIASVAASTLFRYTLNPFVGRKVAFITYFPALVFSAWIGGRPGGLLALILSTLAATFFFITPVHALSILKQPDQFSLLIFIAVGLSVSEISNSQRNAKRLAEASADEARSKQDELRKSEERYRRLIETANEGIITIDTDDRITSANASMAHMLGYTPSQMSGLSLYEILFPSDYEAARERRIQRRRGIAEQYELRLRHKTGQEIWAVANVTVMMEAGKYSGTFGLFTDITERKRTEQDLLARAERESVINRIGEAIRTSFDPAAMQETVSILLGEALQADRCYYVTYELSRDIMRIGRDWRRADLPSVAGEHDVSQFAWVLAELFQGGTAVVADIRASKLSADVQEQFGQRAVLAVPFFSGGDLVAALFAGMTEPRDWTPAEVDLMEQIATLTRAAVDAARVNQREHTIAQQLQEALQPAIPASAPGLELADFYRPALAEAGVGGDFSDVFAKDGNVTFLVIGDLSGKGLAAASQVATVRNMLRYALYNGRTLAGPIAALNRTLVEHQLLVGFATLFVGRYDAATRTLQYVNCGQEPGLIYRADGGYCEELGPTGPVLGSFDTAVFQDCEVVLRDGDTLALFTDGLTEVGPTRLTLLGVAGISDILRQHKSDETPSDTLTRLLTGVDEFARGGARDDVTVLVARVKSSR